METAWFCLVAVAIALYVVFDGFDLGAGILHRFVAHTDEERRQVLRSIGPVWDGNEVWLLAGGGTLYFAFPKLYASSFSGFYLPLIMVLWLLMARGLAIELRSHITGPVWRSLWDGLFAVASTLLAVFLGAALGNVVRGVPLDASGNFFEPLWTNFLSLGPDSGILDWYTVLVGVTALTALTVHGGLWLTLKTHDPVRGRSAAIVGVAWWALALLTVITTLVSFRVQPQILKQVAAHPAGLVFSMAALAGLAGALFFHRRGQDGRAFLCSCGYLLGMLTSVAFGLFPYVLPANTDPALGLTIYNTHAPRYGLGMGLRWWIPGMLLVAGYFIFTYRSFWGRVPVEGEGY